MAGLGVVKDDELLEAAGVQASAGLAAIVAALGGRGDQPASVQLRRGEVAYTVELAAGAIG